MDRLILTFNKEQLKLYEKILKMDSVDLNFDTEIPDCNYTSSATVESAICHIEQELAHLMHFKNSDSVFSAFLTQEEIQALIPVYYEVIRNIERCRRIIGEDTWKLSLKISEAYGICTDIGKRYYDFLPYKAALGSREDYALQIDKIDRQFNESIEKAEQIKRSLIECFDREKKICELVSDFYKKSAKASGEPKFKRFDAYDFFWAVESFTEQIKAIKKQKEM